MKHDVVKHLDIVQAVIARMANNSFLLKGWSITLVAALFALAEKDSNINFAVLALFPALSFWGLDAFYLRQERLFRQLYADICSSINSESSDLIPFSLETGKYAKSVDSWLHTLFAPTVVVLHGTVVALTVGVVLFNKLYFG